MPHTNCGEGKVIGREKKEWQIMSTYFVCKKKCIIRGVTQVLRMKKRRKKNQDNDNKKKVFLLQQCFSYSLICYHNFVIFSSLRFPSPSLPFFHTYYIIYDTILWRHCAYVHVLYCCVLLCCDSSISLVITFSILNSYSLACLGYRYRHHQQQQ